MTIPVEATLAGRLVRLLLDDPRIDPAELDWSLVPRVAESQRILLRLGAWFERERQDPPAAVTAACRSARRHTELGWEIAGRATTLAEAYGVPSVFFRLAQRFPDAGSDLDMLVAERSPALDAALDRAIGEPLGPRPLVTALGGHAPRPDRRSGIILDVHYGRLGRVGEHARLAGLLLEHRVPVTVGSALCYVPTVEDQLLVQALQALYGRRALRMADVCWTLGVVRRPTIDWDYLAEAAGATGLSAGLACYLHLMSQIQERLLGRPLAGPAARLAARGRWGRIKADNGGYRLRVAAVSGRLYLHRLWSGLRRHDWDAAARLSLLPLSVLASAWQRVTHRIRPEGAT